MNSTHYIHNPEIHNQIAPKEVVPLLIKMFKPNSVVDIGCGTGTWLAVFNTYGITDYLGVDASYVDKNQLQIPATNFKEADLSNVFTLPRKFDLLISLEVAEHLPEASANNFIETLTQLSDTIIFSAAIPFQGGQHHINEQWPNYWQKKFEQKGFKMYDVLRNKLWENSNIQWWYKQNIFVVTSKNMAFEADTTNNAPIALIHPDLYLEKVTFFEEIIANYKEGNYGGTMLGLKIIFRSIERNIKSMIRWR